MIKANKVNSGKAKPRNRHANPELSLSGNTLESAETRIYEPTINRFMKSVGEPSGLQSALPCSNAGDDIVRYFREIRRLVHEFRL